LSVTLTVPADPTAVQNLLAPAGFNAFFDPGLGLVDFIEDTSLFTSGSIVGPFTFTSPFTITPVFSALVLDARQSLVTMPVDVIAAAPAPEPTTAGFALFGMVTFIVLRRRPAIRGHR
jgi:hypothetical protein